MSVPEPFTSVDALADAVAERLAVIVAAAQPLHSAVDVRDATARTAIHPLVDTAGAADVLGVPESWLAARARNGEAPCRRLGKYVRFDLAELRAWIDATTSSGPVTGCGPVTRLADRQRSSAPARRGAAVVPSEVPREAA